LDPGDILADGLDSLIQLLLAPTGDKDISAFLNEKFGGG
jgi:hypothetical protein